MCAGKLLGLEAPAPATDAATASAATITAFERILSIEVLYLGMHVRGAGRTEIARPLRYMWFDGEWLVRVHSNECT